LQVLITADSKKLGKDALGNVSGQQQSTVGRPVEQWIKNVLFEFFT
jgi:formylmethanofuran:tetrahydromethanopterin formyltransferase